jgi:hypothetical protein
MESILDDDSLLVNYRRLFQCHCRYLTSIATTTELDYFLGASALVSFCVAGLSLFAGAESFLTAGALAAGLASSFLAGAVCATAVNANTLATIAINDFILNFLLG